MRHILKLHRSLLEPLPETSNNFEISTFLPSLHKEEWLALNNKIFVKHPDQGNWGMADLENRIAENWFDPEGFLLRWKIRKWLASVG
jgi:mycothiol synthase